MRSLEKRQYEIEQGLRDPSELLGGKDKGEDGEEDEEESEAAKAARAENLTKAAIAAANKLLKSTDEVEKMKVSVVPILLGTFFFFFFFLRLWVVPVDVELP